MSNFITQIVEKQFLAGNFLPLPVLIPYQALEFLPETTLQTMPVLCDRGDAYRQDCPKRAF